jgi:hypothetical protein
VRHSQRKTTAGKSRGLASLAGAVGRLLVQEGRGDEELLLALSDSSGWRISDGQRLGKSGVGDGFLGDVRSSAKEGPTHVQGDDRATIGAERSPCGEHGHQELGRRTGPGNRPGQSNRNEPLTCGPGPLNNFSNFQTPIKHVNSKRRPCLAPKIFKLWMRLDLSF